MGKQILGCLFGRESHFIFAVRERFHLRKQNFIKLGGAYVTSTGGPSSIKSDKCPIRWTDSSNGNMGKRCVAAGCSNTHRDGVSLHKFPKDASLRRSGSGKSSERERTGRNRANTASCAVHILRSRVSSLIRLWL